ncbi:hypothetical protein GPA22_17650 [Aromatoleum toluvorans]|uniref:Transcriptional regulator n=1 Tax=Aromatoleum toluvorans TaxID=92002 RepID=A0ABX1Q1H0_9RHOO|nr:hypothetical protein [Aromatoleum toluvorans]NMG45542.1 hypothetical protein [Aromatoleum toluvorans]
MKNEYVFETLKDNQTRVYIIRDDDWDEYRVELWLNGEHQTAADYHTDDALDASQTAENMLAEATK